jgi:heme A synthase
LYSLHLGFRGRTQPIEIRVLSMSAVALFVAQVVVGAFVIWADFSQDLRALHLTMATAVWIAVSALVVMTFSSPGSRWSGASNG